jgi:hypothetical protein
MSGDEHCRVYQKDLGENSDQVITDMKEYTPDGSWKLDTS